MITTTTTKHNNNNEDSSIKPINTLQIKSNARVSSLCFLPKERNDTNNNAMIMRDNEQHGTTNEEDDDDDSDDEPFILKSKKLLSSENTRQQLLLNQYLLASCYVNGEAHLWDLQTNKISFSFGNTSSSDSMNNSSSGGLAVRLVDTGTKLAYQTRNGTVTLFDITKSMKVSSILWSSTSEKKEQLNFSSFNKVTFCSMAVCKNNDTMLVMPSMKEGKDFCTIRDIRCSTNNTTFRVGTVENNNYGMLMSLAMCENLVACGMEDGSLVFHDIRKSTDIYTSIKLSQYFILGLDLAPSVEGSMVAIAGLAGNAEDLQDLPKSEQGTVALVKCKLNNTKDAPQVTLRSRVGTCSLTNNNNNNGGKPGVDVGQFRPDGRLFCIGGWDKRIRFFDRQNAKPLGIVKGYHQSSITAIHWANNSLLASGDNNGKINFWNIPL